MPATPMGTNGVRLPVLNAVKATKQKNTSTTILIITKIELAVALSEAPRSSSQVASRTIRIAVRLITPPWTPGEWVTEAGSSQPNRSRKKWLRYSPQPTATAATEAGDSSTTHQPHTHATSSPRVA